MSTSPAASSIGPGHRGSARQAASGGVVTAESRTDRHHGRGRGGLAGVATGRRRPAHCDRWGSRRRRLARASALVFASRSMYALIAHSARLTRSPISSRPSGSTCRSKRARKPRRAGRVIASPPWRALAVRPPMRPQAACSRRALDAGRSVSARVTRPAYRRETCSAATRRSGRSEWSSADPPGLSPTARTSAVPGSAETAGLEPRTGRDGRWRPG